VKEESSKMSYPYLPAVKPINFRFLLFIIASQQEQANNSIQQIVDGLASNRYGFEGDKGLDSALLKISLSARHRRVLPYIS